MARLASKARLKPWYWGFASPTIERTSPLLISVTTIADCNWVNFMRFCCAATPAITASSALRCATESKVVNTFKPDSRMFGSANTVLSSLRTKFINAGCLPDFKLAPDAKFKGWLIAYSYSFRCSSLFSKRIRSTRFLRSVTRSGWRRGL